MEVAPVTRRAKSDQVFDRYVRQTVAGFKLWMALMKRYVIVRRYEVATAGPNDIITLTYPNRTTFSYKKGDIIKRYEDVLKAIKRLGIIHRVLLSSRRRAGAGGGLVMPLVCDERVIAFIRDEIATIPEFGRWFDNSILKDGVLCMSTFTPLFVLYARHVVLPHMINSTITYDVVGSTLARHFDREFNELHEQKRTKKDGTDVHDNFLGPHGLEPQRGFANTNLQTVVKHLVEKIPKDITGFVEYQLAASGGNSRAALYFPRMQRAFGYTGVSSLNEGNYKTAYDTLQRAVIADRTDISQINKAIKEGTQLIYS